MLARMLFEENDEGCHIWQRAKNSRGYGVIWHDGKVRLAHRVAFFLDRGRWPLEGLVVDHICGVKACVNPRHLQELTNSANLRRAIPRGTPEVEAKRARWRKADAKRRGNYRCTEGGDDDRLVQSG